MIYDFITPSDAITFKTEDPKIAFYVGLFLGRGKATITSEKGDNVPCFLIFSTEEKTAAILSEQLGSDPKAWAEENRELIADCLDSFAYGSIAQRHDYDAAIEAITDPEKLATFKATHEDNQRTSMSRWVHYAWQQATTYRKPPVPA